MKTKKTVTGLVMISAMSFALLAHAHGDVVPQAVNVDGLTPLGEEWLDENPYRAPNKDNAIAIEIGSSAYNQNCARCHGLEAVSGGIAPDLRSLEAGLEGDEWYKERVINGAVRNGAIYMPKMAEFISQEALWAIRTYIESRVEE